MLQHRVDLLLQYILLRAGEEDAFADKMLGPIHLLKYVYLADLLHAKFNQGASFTGVDWTFHHFGPWSVAVQQRIEPAMKALQAERRVYISDFEDRDDCVRWVKSDSSHLRAQQFSLPLEIRVELDGLVHRFKKDTPALLDYVYRTAPMLNAAPGEPLDIAREPPYVRPAPMPTLEATLKARQAKKLKEAARQLRLRHESKAAPKPRYAPKIGPYDDVYAEGLDWLDSLAGPPLQEKELAVEFDDSVWTSEARQANDLP